MSTILSTAHGGQQLRLFNAFHDDYGFQPIVVFDGEGRFVTALLRPGKRPGGYEIRAFLGRLVGAMSRRWRKPLPSASPWHRRAARCGALRNSTLLPAAGAAPSPL